MLKELIPVLQISKAVMRIGIDYGSWGCLQKQWNES